MQERILANMLSRIFIAGWIFVLGGTLLLSVFPRLVFLIPHPEYIRIFLVMFVPISVVYGLVWVYRRGMKPPNDK